MKKIIFFLLAFSAIKSFAQTSMIDFGNMNEKNQEWVLLSDNVMGGITTSDVEYTKDAVVLTGNISLANYGGFSSIKTKFKSVDLSNFNGIKIRYKAANQTFVFTLEDSKYWTEPYYKNAISSNKNDTWEEAIIYFKDFKEMIIGQPTGNKMPLESLNKIVRLGIMTAEKKEGPFSLEVDYIEFVK